MDLHPTLDNYGAHKTQIQQSLVKHPGLPLHFTPTYSSRLNIVERWFTELINRQRTVPAHRSLAALETDRRAWIDA
ncbi:transposase [Micromonospora sp. RP3T]|uniref:transposase n=1 Tax=Micromonospora sp. RP3T TaxID=2135446 RepID=UPI003D7059B4